MKRTLLVAAIALLLTSCGGSGRTYVDPSVGDRTFYCASGSPCTVWEYRDAGWEECANKVPPGVDAYDVACRS